MAALNLNKLTSVLARCLPTDVKNAAKFKVKLMEFDQNLNMVKFFRGGGGSEFLVLIVYLMQVYFNSTFPNMKQFMPLIQVSRANLEMLSSLIGFQKSLQSTLLIKSIGLCIHLVM